MHNAQNYHSNLFLVFIKYGLLDIEEAENGRLLKRVMNAKVNGRGARGRPRLGWMDGVKRALQDRGMDVREARERARDRNAWRAIVRQF